jgi:hypothetical protein
MKKYVRNACEDPSASQAWGSRLSSQLQGAEAGSVAIKRWDFEARWAKKFSRPHLNQSKVGVVVYPCLPTYTGSVKRRMEIQAGQSIK